MINILNADIIRNLAYNLDLLSILNLSQVDRINYYSLDELFYQCYAVFIYGEEFWIRARMRPIQKSRPLLTVKRELIRIELFQKMLDSLNINRWTQKDFYDYWKYD